MNPSIGKTKNKLMDIEKRLVVAKGERGGSGIDWGIWG